MTDLSNLRRHKGHHRKAKKHQINQQTLGTLGG